MTDPVPAGAVQFLAPAIEIAEADAAACGLMGVAVQLDPMWALFPQPEGTAIDVWHKALSEYPADLVAEGVACLIRTRAWDRDPPLPAQVIAPIKEEHSRRIAKLARLRSMAKKAEMGGVETKSIHSTDEDRAAFHARMREKYPEAMGIMDGKAAVKAMPMYPEERMSAETKDRVRSESVGGML